MKPAANFLSRSKNSIEDYFFHLRAFRPNARLYLISVIVMGVALGIFRLLFNFYALSLGYDEAVLGRFVTVNNLTALLVALPIGYFADQFGRKKALISASLLTSLSILSMVLVPVTGILYGANMLFGIGQSLAAITMAPFLMENSGEKERTYLFSFSMGLQMAAGFVGSWVGGYLPAWVSNIRNVGVTSSEAYAGSLLVVGLIMASGVIPLSLLKTHPLLRSERSIFAPLDYARRKPALLGKLIFPMLVTSIGAGLIMPFMNVYFREVHLRPDHVIGTLFAWGSLAMAVGLMIAPPIAERMTHGQNSTGGGHTGFIHSVPDHLRIFALVLDGCGCLFCAAFTDEHERTGLPDLCDGTGRCIRTCYCGKPGEYVVEFWLGIQSYDQRMGTGQIWFWPGVSRNDIAVFAGDPHDLGILLAENSRPQTSAGAGGLISKNYSCLYSP